jgi:hypothetical protein
VFEKTREMNRTLLDIWLNVIQTIFAFSDPALDVARTNFEPRVVIGTAGAIGHIEDVERV